MKAAVVGRLRVGGFVGLLEWFGCGDLEVGVFYWCVVVRLVAGNRRLYGGLVVHAGVVLFALAFTMSSAFSAEREATLRHSESTSLHGYTITYVGDRTERNTRKTTVSADLQVERDGRDLGTYAPALSTFAASNQAIGTPSVRTGVREDIYLTLIAPPTEGRVVIRVRVNPLVVWLWIGAAVMVAGTAIAAWPEPRSRRRRPPPADQPAHDEPAAHADALDTASTAATAPAGGP